MSAPEDPRLALALRLARRAGRRALERWGQATAAWKRPGERVTDTDLVVQAGLVQEVRARFPGDGLIAEEQGARWEARREFVWILDPLDGTNNYALGIPCFAVSIGIFRLGEPWAGVLHDPNTGLCWRALRGQGARLGERALALPPRPLAPESNVSVRVPVEPTLEPVIAGWLRRHKLRGFGSVALHLGYAALGAIDLVLDQRAALWDLAGGAAVLLAAGGRLTDPAGRALFPFDLEAYGGEPVPFLAGNPAAHAAAVAECRAALGRARGRPPR